VTKLYDGRYVTLAYPGGDVPMERGVCTDVIVRAYRQFGIDLQQLIHEDMRRNGSVYPKLWKLTRPDPNIDHRRVPNQAKFFARQGQVAPISADQGVYLPGDLVTWRLPVGVPHIGIISERRSEAGTAAFGGGNAAGHPQHRGRDGRGKYPVFLHHYWALSLSAPAVGRGMQKVEVRGFSAICECLFCVLA